MGVWRQVTEVIATKMSFETSEDFINDNVLLHTAKSPGRRHLLLVF